MSNVLRSPWSSLLHHTSPWFSRNAVQMLSHGQYWRGIITLMVIRGPRTLVIWTQQKRGVCGGGGRGGCPKDTRGKDPGGSRVQSQITQVKLSHHPGQTVSEHFPAQITEHWMDHFGQGLWIYCDPCKKHLIQGEQWALSSKRDGGSKWNYAPQDL